MADSVEDRVVEMKFNNSTFESKIQDTIKSLANLQKSLDLSNAAKGFADVNTAANKVDLTGVAENVETIRQRFSALGIVAYTTLSNITNRFVDAGINWAKQFTFAPLSAGFGVMETKIGAVQTILANTSRYGTSLQQVNEALDKLNQYSDKTIYSFADMTKNVGLFTNAGIRIEDATSMIQGFSNEAAASGTSMEGAAGAAYQLSQALSNGVVHLMDWRSLTNVGMGNKNMQAGIIEIAKSMGTLKSAGLSSSEVTAHFNETLEKGWLTADVMTNYLKIMAGTMDATQMKTLGLSKATIDMFTKQQQTAQDAAQKVRTWSQLISVVKDSLATGWSKSFSLIIGDFNQATEVFTGINNAVGGFITKITDARNNLLKGWAEQVGRQWFFDALKIGLKTVAALMQTVADAFHAIFPPMTVNSLVHVSWLFQDFIVHIDKAVRGILPGLKNILEFVFSTIKLGATIVQSVAKLFIDFFKALYPDRVATNSLGFLGNLAAVLTKLNLYLIKSGVPGFFKLLGKVLVPVASVIGKVTSAIIDFFFSFEYSKPFEAVVGLLGGFAKKIGDFFSSIKDSTAVAALGGAVSNLWHAIQGLFDTVKGSSQVASAFGFLDTIRDKVTNFFTTIDFQGKLESIISSVANFANKLAGYLGSFDYSNALHTTVDMLGKVKDKVAEFFSALGNIDFGGVIDKITSLNDKTEKFYKTIGAKDLGGQRLQLISADEMNAQESGLSAFFQRIGDYFGAFWETLKGYGGNLKDTFGAIEETIVSFFTGERMLGDNRSGFEILVTIIKEILITGILYQVATFIKEFKGMMKNAKDVFGQFGSILKNFREDSKPTALIKIAIAMVLLVKSLQMLAGIDKDALIQAFSAMTAGFAELFLMLKGMDKSIKGNNTEKMAATLIAIGVSMILLAKAMQEMAKLNWDELKKGLLGATTGLAALGGAVAVMGKFGEGKFGMSGGIGIALLAGSLFLIAKAVEMFGTMKPDVLAQGLATVVAALMTLGLVGAALGEMGPWAILGAAAVVILSFALFKIADAIERFNSIPANAIAKGIVSIGIALGVIGGVANAFPPYFLLIAAGLPRFAEGLLIIGDALIKIGSIKGGDLAKALLGLGLALGFIISAVEGMQGALLGVIGLIVAAEAIKILTDAIINLGKQSFKTLAVGIGVITIALLGLAAAGAFLSPFIALLGASLLLFGAGLVLVGLGAYGMAKAIEVLAKAGKLHIQEVIDTINSFIRAIPQFLVTFVESLAQAAVQISDSFDTIVTQVEQMIIRALQAVINVLPKIEETVVKIIATIINVIDRSAANWIAMGFRLLLALGQGLLDNIGSLTITAVEIITRFLDTLAAHAPSLIDSGMRLLEAFIWGIYGRIDELVALGVTVILKFLYGVASQAIRLASGAADVLINFLNALAITIEEKAPEIREAGANVALAILDGISFGLLKKENIKKVVESIKGLAKNMIDGFKEIIPFSSPSPLFIDIAGYMAEGLAIGLDKDSLAKNAAVRHAEEIVSSFQKTLADMPGALDEMEEFRPVITPVLDLTRVQAGARGLNGMMSVPTLTPDVSMSQANLIAKTAEETPASVEIPDSGPRDITFIQNNHSPKALSTNDIYRNSKSQFALAKEELGIK